MVMRSASLSDKIAGTAVALTIRDAVPHAEKAKCSRISIRRGQAISPIGDSLLAPNAARLPLANGHLVYSRNLRTPTMGRKSLFAHLRHLREP